MITDDDVDSLKLTLGQTKLLKKALGCKESDELSRSGRKEKR